MSDDSFEFGRWWFDQHGEPLSVHQWTALFELDEYRIVGRDTVGEMVVSTVWLGIDMGFGEVPQLFETMIFGGEHDSEQWRYSTLEAATAGHAAVVAQLKAAAQ